jgi:hypothetical protein
MHSAHATAALRISQPNSALFFAAAPKVAVCETLGLAPNHSTLAQATGHLVIWL